MNLRSLRARRARAPLSTTLLLSLLALFALLFPSCAEPLPAELELTPATQTLVSGQTVQLTVTRKFPGGSVEDVTTRVAYASSDRSRGVAVINERGVLTAGAEGSVIVTVRDASTDSTVAGTFTVVAARVASIDISPAPAIVMTRGTTRAFTATARLNNGTARDVTREVLWSSTNEAAAIVGNTQLDKGSVAAVAEGDTTILATDAFTLVQGRSVVFVAGTTPVLQAIIVSPNPAQIAVTQSVEMSALGVYNDGSTKNLTKTAAWSSSRADVATVDAGGVVKGIAPGDSTVTASAPVEGAGGAGGAGPTIRGSAAAKVVP